MIKFSVKMFYRLKKFNCGVFLDFFLFEKIYRVLESFVILGCLKDFKLFFLFQCHI
jgi:hypothetical protein